MSDQNIVLGNEDANLIERRDVLKMGLTGVLATTLPLGFAQDAHAKKNTWRVSFRNAHTGDSFNGVYRVGNKYMPEAFERMNYVLRDFRTGEVFPMDPRVIDILALVQQKSGQRKHVDILSGYRSPKTNARLRKNTNGVARNSFHMYGQALDMRIEGFSTRSLRNIATGLKAGGVGYYPKSSFVHIDTGAVRTW